MGTGKTNWLAVVVIVVLAMAIGFLWYGPLFGDAWMELVGTTLEEIEANSSPLPYVVAIVATVLFCWLLSTVIHLAGDTTAAAGAKWGFLLWACVTAPIIFTHNGFSLRPIGLSLLQSGNELLTAVVAGAILGAWRPKGG